MKKYFGLNWELLKFEIGKYLRKYVASLAKSRRAVEESVVSEIISFSNIPTDSLSEDEKLKLSELQQQLDTFTEMKQKAL